MLSCAKLLQSCLTLSNPMDYSPLVSSVLGDSPGKTTVMSCPALLQGIFPTQGSNLHFLCPLHWQEVLYHWCHLGSPKFYISKSTIFLHSTKEVNTILWGVHKSTMFRTKKSRLSPNVHGQPPPCVWTSCSEMFRETQTLHQSKNPIWQEKYDKILEERPKFVSTAWKTARWKRNELHASPKESVMWNQQRQGWGGARDDVYRGGIWIRFTSWGSTSRIGAPAWPHPLLSTILVNMMASGWEEEKEKERMKGVGGKERDKRRKRGRKGLEFWAKDPGFYHHCGSSSPPTASNDTSLAQHPSLHPVLQGNQPEFQLFIKGKLSSVISASFVGCQHFFFYFKIKFYFDSHLNDGSSWKIGTRVKRQVQLKS